MAAGTGSCKYPKPTERGGIHASAGPYSLCVDDRHKQTPWEAWGERIRRRNVEAISDASYSSPSSDSVLCVSVALFTPV